MDVPQEVMKLWDKYNLPDNVKRHCIKVAEVALKIAKRLSERGLKVDLEAVKLGALLHDIGRAITHGIEHFVHTGEILRREGVDERIVKIAERHFSCGITKEEAEKLGLKVAHDYIPETLEEKIVCMADKLVKGEEEIDFEEFLQRLEELKKIYPESAWFSDVTRQRALKLKEELLINDSGN